MNFNRFKSALQFSLIHLCVNLIIAMFIALLVFLIWFPGHLKYLSDAVNLFFIIIAVDVVCGPLLSLVIYNPLKSKKEKIIDLSLIVGIQVLALFYGLYTLSLSRPVATVFEVDRFRVVTLADIDAADIEKAPTQYQHFPLWGRHLLSVAKLTNQDDKLKSIELSLSGKEAGVMPQRWQAYALAKTQILAKAKPLDLLEKKYPSQISLIENTLSKHQVNKTDALWLPVVSYQHTDWIVILDKNTTLPLDYLHLDGFF